MVAYNDPKWPGRGVDRFLHSSCPGGPILLARELAMMIREKDRHGARWIAWCVLFALGLATATMARGQAAGDATRDKAYRHDHGPDPTTSGERRDTVYLPPGGMARLGVRTEPARVATHPGALVLRGMLAVDPERLVRVRARFGGEVVEVGTTRGAEGKMRHLRPGDRVGRDTLLAIIWSSELSQLKNVLLNLISRLHLERETFERVEKLHKQGVVTERSFQEDKRELEECEIEAARAERSLQARGVPAEEVDAVAAEAEVVRKQGKRSPFNKEKSWARFPIHSPIDGRILDAKAAD